MSFQVLGNVPGGLASVLHLHFPGQETNMNKYNDLDWHGYCYIIYRANSLKLNKNANLEEP